jgi:hypothetical protein
VFWFPNYMIEDPFETLRNRGRVEFTEAESDDDSPVRFLPDDLDDYLPGGRWQGELFYIGATGQEPDDLPERLRALYEAGGYDLDRCVDPGLYFVRKDRLVGPYAATFSGADDATKDGAAPTSARPPEPAQPSLGF